MEIVDIQYGPFSGIEYLKKRFIPGAEKMKLTLKITLPPEVYQRAFPLLIEQFIFLFPNLEKHDCCDELQPTNSNPIAINLNSYEIVITETVHLVEHVIIEILCSVLKMDICSAIACFYCQPDNTEARLKDLCEIYVEYPDRKVGRFAARFALKIVQRVCWQAKLNQLVRSH